MTMYSFFLLILFYTTTVQEYQAKSIKNARQTSDDNEIENNNNNSNTTTLSSPLDPSKVVAFRFGSSNSTQQCVCLTSDACDQKDVIDFTRPEYLNVSDSNCDTSSEVCCRNKVSPRIDTSDSEFPESQSPDLDSPATQSPEPDSPATQSSEFPATTQSSDAVTITAVAQPNCTCVPFYQCNDTDFIDYNNVRSIKNENVGSCPLGEVCCNELLFETIQDKTILYRIGTPEVKQERCKCVAFFECPAKDSIDFNTPGFLKENVNATCPSEGEVCCRISADEAASSNSTSASKSVVGSHSVIDYRLDAADDKTYSCDCVPFYLCDDSNIIDFSRPEYVNASDASCQLGSEVCCREGTKASSVLQSDSAYEFPETLLTPPIRSFAPYSEFQFPVPAPAAVGKSLEFPEFPSGKSLDFLSKFTGISHEQPCSCVPFYQCNQAAISPSACAHTHEVCCHAAVSTFGSFFEGFHLKRRRSTTSR